MSEDHKFHLFQIIIDPMMHRFMGSVSKQVQQPAEPLQSVETRDVHDMELLVSVVDSDGLAIPASICPKVGLVCSHRHACALLVCER